MKRFLLAALAAVFLSGCATAHMPVTGFMYGNVKGPMTATATAHLSAPTPIELRGVADKDSGTTTATRTADDIISTESV